MQSTFSVQPAYLSLGEAKLSIKLIALTIAVSLDHHLGERFIRKIHQVAFFSPID